MVAPWDMLVWTLVEVIMTVRPQVEKENQVDIGTPLPGSSPLGFSQHLHALITDTWFEFPLGPEINGWVFDAISYSFLIWL
jgi:hypothetical protein